MTARHKNGGRYGINAMNATQRLCRMISRDEYSVLGKEALLEPIEAAVEKPESTPRPEGPAAAFCFLEECWELLPLAPQQYTRGLLCESGTSVNRLGEECVELGPHVKYSIFQQWLPGQVRVG